MSEAAAASVARARAVVGLYGDPDASGSIAIDVRFGSAQDVTGVPAAATRLAADYPHLGAGATPSSIPGDDARSVLSQLLDEPYGDHAPLLRVAVTPAGDRLIVAAHQGAVDGLGLLAVVATLLGRPLTSSARGVGAAAAGRGLLRASALRLAEAVVAPPARLAREVSATDGSGHRGDVTAAQALPALHTDTAAAVSAAARAVTAWNHRQGARRRPLVVAVGVSRRSGARAAPDRDAAYVRLRLGSALDERFVRRRLQSARPEPAFPERSVSPVTAASLRILRRRLGSTLLLSNLGSVAGPQAPHSIAFYPAATGRQALAVGLTSTPTATTVTVRAPRADLGQGAAYELAAAVARLLAGTGG